MSIGNPFLINSSTIELIGSAQDHTPALTQITRGLGSHTGTDSDHIGTDSDHTDQPQTGTDSDHAFSPSPRTFPKRQR